MKSFLSFFKKNLFLNLFLCCTFMVTNNSFSQSQTGTGTQNDENEAQGWREVGFFLSSISGLLLGGLSTLTISVPSPKIEIDNDEILSCSDSLIQNKKPLRLSIDWEEDKFGTIKSINKDYLLLNEEPDTIKLANISSIMDLESAAGRAKAHRTKLGVFTFFSGLGLGLGVMSWVSDSKQSTLITVIFMGALYVGTEILILTSRSDAEKEWEKYDQNKLGKSDDNGMKLSLGLGLLNLGAVHTAANVVYTNISPCITAKLCF